MLNMYWKSVKAKNQWESVIKDIASQLNGVELKANRDVALQYLVPADLLKFLGRLGKVYQLVDVNETHGHRWIIGEAASRVFYAADCYRDRCDRELGELLGFPQCCIDHFVANWKPGYSDPTRLMEKGNDPYCNIIYRWLGIRPVFHLPCSFDCKETSKLGKEIVGLYGNLKAPLLYLLSLPAKYSLLNGVVEVENELFKFCTDDTDGDVFFSMDIKPAPMIYSNRLAHKDSVRTANGFSSQEAENKAHQAILDTLKELEYSSILDLGCGDGSLLQKAAALESHNVMTFGIDCENKLKVKLTLFKQGLLKDVVFPTVDLTLVSVRRLEEDPSLLAKAKFTCKHLLVYDYDTDPIQVTIQ